MEVPRESNDDYRKWKLTTLTAAFAAHSGKKAGELKKELGPRGYEEMLNSFAIENASRRCPARET